MPSAFRLIQSYRVGGQLVHAMAGSFNRTVVGLVTNGQGVRDVGRMAIQLSGGRLPVVAFVVGMELKPMQVSYLSGLGVRIVRMNHVPVPSAFGHARVDPFKFSILGLWSHTEYQKIVHLDTDILVNGDNVDEMASFPPDTFSPNICMFGCGRRVSGYNAGVAVIGPSRERFESMMRYAASRAAGKAAGPAAMLPSRI